MAWLATSMRYGTAWQASYRGPEGERRWRAWVEHIRRSGDERTEEHGDEEGEMNVETWVALGGLALTVVGWFIRLERRLGTTLTRDEHEKICSERNARAEKSLDNLQEQTERRHEGEVDQFRRMTTHG